MNTFKEKIKLTVADPDWRQKLAGIKKSQKRKVFVFGTPMHGNLGDHAIAAQEQAFFEDFFPAYEYHEILMPLYHTQKKKIQSLVHPDDLIVISGGGWMGNLWLHNEIVIREIISAYPRNEVIIFPQTAYYTPDEEGEKERECTAHFFEGHRNLRIFVREQKSFDLIREHFSLEGKSQVYLVPDIVLYGKGIAGRAGQPSDTINVCIRSDCESTQTDGRKLLAELKGQYPVRGLSTMVKSPLSLKNRKKELSRVFADFAEGKVLVTDRLHAMLFSVLSGTPCIALDNKTGKVFGVADWLKDTGMVILADSSDQVLEILRERRDWPHKGYDRGQLLGEFERMAELIRGD